MRQILNEREMSNDALCVAIARATGRQWVMRPIDVTHLTTGRRIVSTVELVVLAAALQVSTGFLLGEESDATILSRSIDEKQ